MPQRAHDLPDVQHYAKHVNPALARLLGVLAFGRAFVRASDVWLFDHTGKRYLDALSSFGVTNLGHNHPRIRSAINRCLDSEPFQFVHIAPSLHQGRLAKRLIDAAGAPLEVAIFSNTGAEAVEGGLKLARAATGRTGVVYCDHAYHGNSLGTLPYEGSERMRKPFSPLLGFRVTIPFGDLDALEAVLKHKQMAAFLIDPAMSALGLMTPPPGYLKAAQELCRRYGTLMVLDEVQTGLGRTGHLFAFHAEDFTPDILAIAKALSGGAIPIGATLARADIHHAAFGTMDSFDLHMTTFGGGALACTVAEETLDVLRDEHLVENSRDRGKELLDGLRSQLSGHPLVRDIRGRGLFVAIDLGPTDRDWMSRFSPDLVEKIAHSAFGQWAAVRLLEEGVVVQPANQSWNVIKIMPPLTATTEHVQILIETTARVLETYPGVPTLLKDVTGRLGRQFIRRWAY